MKVRFLQDYRGVKTQERWFEKHAVVELDDTSAHALVRDGFAEKVKTSEPVTVEVEPTPEEATADVSLLDLDGISEDMIEPLREHGIVTVYDMAHASPGTLERNIPGIGKKTAPEVIEQAQALVYPVDPVEEEDADEGEAEDVDADHA